MEEAIKTLEAKFEALVEKLRQHGIHFVHEAEAVPAEIATKAESVSKDVVGSAESVVASAAGDVQKAVESEESKK